MTRAKRIIAAATLAIQRNEALFNTASGLSEVRINIKLDNDGRPKAFIAQPIMEGFLVSKSIDNFTFDAT